MEAAGIFVVMLLITIMLFLANNSNNLRPKH